MALPTGLALAASLARGVHLGAGLVGGVRLGEVPLGTQLVPGLFPCVPDGMDCTKVIFSGGAVRHSLFSWHFLEEKLVTCHGSHTLGAWPVHKNYLRRCAPTCASTGRQHPCKHRQPPPAYRAPLAPTPIPCTSRSAAGKILAAARGRRQTAGP